MNIRYKLVRASSVVTPNIIGVVECGHWVPAHVYRRLARKEVIVLYLLVHYRTHTLRTRRVFLNDKYVPKRIA